MHGLNTILDGIGWIPFETTPGFEGSDSAFSGNDRRTDDSSDPSDNTEAPNEPDSSGDREDTYQNDNPSRYPPRASAKESEQN